LGGPFRAQVWVILMPNPPTYTVTDLCQVHAGQAPPPLGAIIILHKMITQAPDRVVSELSVLAAVARILAERRDLPEALSAVMQTLVDALPQADMGAIMLWDQSAGLFRSAAAVGYDVQALQEIGLEQGESLTGKAYDEGRGLLWRTPEQVSRAMANLRPDNRKILARSMGAALPSSAIAAPIQAGAERFGVLVLEALESGAGFSEKDLALAEMLADVIALAIDRARVERRAASAREGRQGDQERSELMGALSHELRMPLATIKGYATALQMDGVTWTPDKQQEFLKLIEEACDEMEGMLKDILQTALIGTDQFTLERHPVNLPRLAAELAGEIQRRSPMHHTVVDFPPAFPEVRADAGYLKQVLRNVLDNAVKYSPHGGLIVVRGEIAGDNAIISIADQGIGIAPADQVFLFEKYFRVRAMETAHIPGTGLGLPLARALVEAHGGRIWIESKPGEGTTVHFSLPLGVRP